MRKLLMALAMLVAMFASSARADDTDQIAKQSYERGRQLAGESKYTQAYDAFSAGYDASHRPVFLFNMAECARALDDAPRARNLYQQFLAVSPTGDLASTARTRLAALGATAAPPPATPTPTPIARTTTPATTPPPVTHATTPTPATHMPTPTPVARTTTPPPAPTHTAPAPNPPIHATTLSPPTNTTTVHTAPQLPPTVATTRTAPPPPVTTTHLAATTTPVATTPATTTTPAPNLTVAQLPPSSPAERSFGTSGFVDTHPSEPIWRRTSFWVGVGVAVVVGTVAVIAASSHNDSCSGPSCVDLR
jgi:hypothetical protein